MTTMMKTRFLAALRIATVALVSGSLLAASSAKAQSTWDGSESNLWSNAGNWDSSPATPTAGTLIFSGTANQTNTNDAGITSIGTLTLSNAGWDINLGAAAVTITGITTTGSSTLTGNVIMTDGTPRTITLNGTNSTLTIGGSLSLNRTNTMALNVNGVGNTLNLGGLALGGNYARSIAGSSNVTVNGAVSGGNSSRNFTWSSTGTFTLNGTNSYLSQTVISAGTLRLNGSLSANSTVSVGASGTLAGTGTINGATTILGAHTPGTSPGIQTFGNNLTYSGGNSTVQWELADNTTTNQSNPNAIFDQIIVSGSLSFTDLTTLSLSFNGTGSSVDWTDSFWNTSQSWTLYDVAGTTSSFGNLAINVENWLDGQIVPNAFSTARPSSSFSLSQVGNDVILNYVAVPEPGTLALLAAGGAIGLGLLRRRQKMG
jgi:autotransporter-associated beta strand protein